MKPILIPPGIPFWHALQYGYVPPIESETYLKWVRSLPCVITRQKPVDAHHIVGHGLKPVGGKVSDLLTIPLSPDLHRPDFPNGLHRLGHKEWERRYGDQRISVMETLVQAVYEGVIKL